MSSFVYNLSSHESREQWDRHISEKVQVILHASVGKIQLLFR